MLSVGLFGRASHPETQLSSDSNRYTQDQLLGFVVGGAPGGDPSAQSSEAARNAIVLGASAFFGRRLSQVLPIQVDTLTYEPSTTATSATLSAGRWLTRRWFLSLRKRFNALLDENPSEIGVQHRRGRATYELSGGSRVRFSADVLWRWRL